MSGVENNYSQNYLNAINEQTFARADGAGNNDGKVSVKEALDNLNIAELLSGQTQEEAAKLKSLTDKIPDVLAKYAGEDGVFTAQEYADFLNGKEWGEVLDVWHSSSAKTKLEMNWTDMAHLRDGKVTKGEVKVGLLNNLSQQGINIDTTELADIVDSYAGEDGTFTLEEFMQMKQDPKYKEYVQKYNIVPWFKFGV